MLIAQYIAYHVGRLRPGEWLAKQRHGGAPGRVAGLVAGGEQRPNGGIEITSGIGQAHPLTPPGRPKSVNSGSMAP
jgi:hypothetical protein